MGLLGRFGARRLSSSWDVLVRADAYAASVWFVVRAPEPGMSMSCEEAGKMLYSFHHAAELWEHPFEGAQIHLG